MARSRSQKCCYDYCCETCVEFDILSLVRTRLYMSVALRGLGGTFTEATLTGSGVGPATIASAADLNDVEVPAGYMTCEHFDLSCIKPAIEALVAGLGDSVIFGTGASDGKLCGGGFVEFTYGAGYSLLEIGVYPFTFTTENGARYLGVAVTKTDGDAAFPDRPGLAKFDSIGLIGTLRMSDETRIVCDGIEEEISLAPYEDFYDAQQCNNFSGDFYEQCTGPTSVVLKLYLV